MDCSCSAPNTITTRVSKYEVFFSRYLSIRLSILVFVLSHILSWCVHFAIEWCRILNSCNLIKYAIFQMDNYDSEC